MPKKYSKSNNNRFKFLCETFLDTGILSYSEMGRLYGQEVEVEIDGKIKKLIDPVTRQALWLRRSRL